MEFLKTTIKITKPIEKRKTETIMEGMGSATKYSTSIACAIVSAIIRDKDIKCDWEITDDATNNLARYIRRTEKFLLKNNLNEYEEDFEE